MTELTPEEEALLLAADVADESAPVIEEAAPVVGAQTTVEEPKKRGRKPRAVETDVEPADEAPSSATDLDLRVIPAQHHGDPWGDTPLQSRF